MKRTTLGIFSFKSYLVDLKKYRILIILLFFFVCGLVCGTFLFRNSVADLSPNIADYVSTNLFKRSELSFFKIFCTSLVSVIPFFLSAFIFGLSPFGTVLVPLIALLRGSGIGLITGYLYKTYEIKGIAFCLLILMPAFLFSSFVFLLSGCESIKFSAAIFRAFSVKSGPVSFSGDFRIYLSRYFLILLLILLCSFLDTIFSVAFIRFFEF